MPFRSSPREKESGDSIHAVLLSFPGRHGVNACRIDTGVAEKVGEPDDVLLVFVVVDCKKVAEIVWKDLTSIDVCIVRQAFHPMQNVASVNRPPGSGDENAAGCDTLFGAPYTEDRAQT